MSEHRVGIRWQNPATDFVPETYSRDHEWTARQGNVRLRATAAPDFRGSPDGLDPEDALVGALASCHMLTFLAIAAKKRLVVQDYSDDASGFLEKNEAGKLALTRVILRPQVRFASGTDLDRAGLEKLHHRAHEECFIANSVKSDVRIEIRG